MDFVTIRTFQNYFTAHILLSRFRDSGIECFLKDEFLVTVDPILSNAVGGIKLVVKKEDEEEANLLLQQFDESYRQAQYVQNAEAKQSNWFPKKQRQIWLLQY